MPPLRLEVRDASDFRPFVRDCGNEFIVFGGCLIVVERLLVIVLLRGRRMRTQLKKYLKYSPILLGALGGYLYYVFIGCAGGTCPLTSNPWTSAGYGALVGFLLVPRKPKKTANENPESGS